MKILVINAGSSSLKYQLIDMTDESQLAIGNCERIGAKDSVVTNEAAGKKEKYEAFFKDHGAALEKVIDLLTKGDQAVIENVSEIGALGHRVVQGGELFSESVLVSEEALKDIAPLAELAPLHNPANIMAIETCRAIFGTELPQVMVFDTSFHQTIPEKAYTFPIPYELSEKYSIRRYGFHGTSHRFVSARLAEIVGKPLEELKIVTCHLGNGSSIAAVNKGKVLDTSMGFTPLDGIIMGTRCGGIDPSIVTFLQEKEGLSAAEVNDIMNKKSGYLGVSGISNDARDLHTAADNGNHRARLALEIQHYQITKYVGAYAAAMNGLDYVIFTGGIGENSPDVRKEVCTHLEFIGMKFDEEKNEQVRGIEVALSTPDSKVGAYIIPTNEELLIARDTYQIAKSL